MQRTLAAIMNGSGIRKSYEHNRTQGLMSERYNVRIDSEKERKYDRALQD